MPFTISLKYYKRRRQDRKFWAKEKQGDNTKASVEHEFIFCRFLYIIYKRTIIETGSKVKKSFKRHLDVSQIGHHHSNAALHYKSSSLQSYNKFCPLAAGGVKVS